MPELHEQFLNCPEDVGILRIAEIRRDRVEPDLANDARRQRRRMSSVPSPLRIAPTTAASIALRIESTGVVSVSLWTAKRFKS